MNTATLNKIEAEREKKHRFCRSRGGESCAFDGALIVLQPIADAVHLIHGPISCCANAWQGRGTISERGSFHKRGFSTDLSELDIIVGTENKLTKAIELIFNEFKTKAIFVYSTCVTGLLGEDIERICINTGKRLGIDVVPVNVPGFIGPKNLGNRIAGEVLLKYIIGREEPPLVTDRDINLIGEYNIAGDQFLIESLLNKAGFRILSRITGNSTFREIKWAHRAKLNVVICGRALLNVAIEMEKRYRIPFIELSFFGKKETEKALRLIANALDKDGSLIRNIEDIIVDEEKRFQRRLEAFKDILGKKAVLYTGGVKSWSMISALEDIGIDVVAVGTKKSTYEDEEKIKELVGENCLLFEDTSPANILKIMKEKKADILIAGGRNQYLAIKEGLPFVDVNQERHRAYAGYDGLINLAEEISKAIRFYEPAKVANSFVKNLKKEVLVDPLKNSPFIGAVMAFQGINRAMPLLHSAQGCNFLGKVLLMKHFREPISMMTTKLFTEDVIMGSEKKLSKSLEVLKQKGASLVAVITGALSHIKGESLNDIIKTYNDEEFFVIHIPLPDYKGSLQYGYSKALEELLSIIPKAKEDRKSGQINVIAGGHLTPADFHELREKIELFGLNPLFLTDLSLLDGSRDFSEITKGGTDIKEIRKMASSEFTVVIGESLKYVGEKLKEKTGIDYKVFSGLVGLKGNDDFFNFLSELSMRKIPEKIKRERKILIDGMRDTHFYLTGKKIALALEPDMVIHLAELLNEMKIRVKVAIIPEESRFLKTSSIENIVIGSLSDLKNEFDLIISNSHALETSKKLNTPLYEMGFPVYKTFGYSQKITVGYKGSLNIVNDIANIISKKEVH